MRRSSLIILSVIIFFASGCSIFNPFYSEFKCPDAPLGKCITVREAYKESFKPDENTQDEKTEKDREQKQEKQNAGEKNTYQEELYRRLSGLLREPKAPVAVPPKVIRVLVLPYRGSEGELYMMRYVYVFAEKPRWILTDPFVMEEK